jgi:hypothetical protein
MTTETATIIKGGAMVASGGLIGDLIIFNDPSYIPLSLVGAIVSASGVIHELSKHDEVKLFKALAEVLKGIVLGLLAIPLWYLLLTDAGNDVIKEIFGFAEPTKVGKSVMLIISFMLSWFTVPLFNWFFQSSIKVANFILNRFLGGSK